MCTESTALESKFLDTSELANKFEIKFLNNGKYSTPKKNYQTLLRYRSKIIIASRRAVSALQKRSLLYKKQKY
jgi:hypothetical protein